MGPLYLDPTVLSFNGFMGAVFEEGCGFIATVFVSTVLEPV